MAVEAVHRVPPLADIRTERARRHLDAFVEQAWHTIEPATPYLSNWHIDAICEHLEAVLRGEITQLLINMPPRMMKSLTVSVFFPAWAWIDRPWLRFLYSSYAQSLATDHSLATRRVIESDWYQERWSDRFALAGDQNLKTTFENDHRGARFSTSVGGAATGKGGNIIVCDDPHNVKESESDAVREATLLWWDQVMSTRLNDPKTGAKIIVMQRVHDRDLSGHVLAQGGYEHLSLPMEYEPTTRITGIGWKDPRSAPGELLAPDRFGVDEVQRSRRQLGSRGYAGQMQQRPAPAEGDIIKRQWWRFWQRPGLGLPPVRMALADGRPVTCPVAELPDRFDQQAQSWDMTFKETKSGSYVVGQIWAGAGAKRFLLDQVRGRMGFSDACTAVESLSAAWPGVITKYVESKANGPAVVDALRSTVGGFVEVEPEGGKEARANAVTPMIEAGDVFLPHPEIAPWVWDFIEECAAFPSGANDDQVDGMSQALVKMRKKRIIGAFDLSGMERANPLAGIG